MEDQRLRPAEGGNWRRPCSRGIQQHMQWGLPRTLGCPSLCQGREDPCRGPVVSRKEREEPTKPYRLRAFGNGDCASTRQTCSSGGNQPPSKRSGHFVWCELGARSDPIGVT